MLKNADTLPFSRTLKVISFKNSEEIFELLFLFDFRKEFPNKFTLRRNIFLYRKLGEMTI